MEGGREKEGERKREREREGEREREREREGERESGGTGGLEQDALERAHATIPLLLDIASEFRK